MSNEHKIISNKFLFSAVGVCLYAFFVGLTMETFSTLWKAGLIFSIFVIMILFLISIGKRNEKLYKFNIVCVYFLLLCVVIINLIIKSGILKEINDIDSIVKIVQNSGINGKLLFILIQFLQVTFVPIPSSIVTAAGAIIFSRTEALVLSCIGLILGSIVAFILGRIFGVKLVKWMVGQDALDKYYQMIKGRDKTLLVFMFIFPIFPDDLLCMIAGLTSMSFPAFIFIQLISRPLNVSCSIYLVEIAKIIPFRGWGLLAWAILFIIGLILFIWAFKNSEKLEQKMVAFFNKLVGKTSINKAQIELTKDINTDIDKFDKVDNRKIIEEQICIIESKKEKEEVLDYNQPNIDTADNIINNKKKDISVDF